MEESSLTKTANFIKAEKYLIIFAILAIFFFILFLASRFPAKTGSAYKDRIYPGKTTKNQVQSKLGTPEKTGGVNGAESYLYQTTNQFRKDQVEFSGDLVSVVKEQVIANEKGKLADYFKKYGKEESILYGPHLTFAPGSFWGKSGLIVFANQNDGTIIEIWYFEPQTLEEFLAKNPNISKDPQHEEER